MTSRDRDLNSFINNRRVDQRVVRLTSWLFRMTPVRISGPFYGLMRRCARDGKTTDSVKCDCNRTAIRIGWQTHIHTFSYIRLIVHTCDHFTGVVDHTLVVIIVTVRKVHAHCCTLSGSIIDLCQPDSPMLTPARRSSASFSTVFTFGPCARVLSLTSIR